MHIIHRCDEYDLGRRFMQSQNMPAWIQTHKWHMYGLYGRNVFCGWHFIFMFYLPCQYLFRQYSRIVFCLSRRHLFGKRCK